MTVGESDGDGAADHAAGLSADEQRGWQAFSRASTALYAAVGRELQRAGVTPAYYDLLVLLSEAPGRALRMSELGVAAGSKPSRVTHAVTRLEHAGLVRRRSCNHDRRGWYAVLTDAGLAALRATRPAHADAVRQYLIDPLTPEELDLLARISEKLLAHLEGIGGG